MQQRPSSMFAATTTTTTFPGDFSDARLHGRQGPSRSVRLPRATVSGGGTVARSDDGVRCVVAGRESLRVLRLSDPDDVAADPNRVELSRNLWNGSGLKIESTSTDVAWCSGNYSNKILTSARNGDLIMWDIDKPGSSKYECKTRNHIRSIHKLACSSAVPYYCITGSADGDMRIWDLRDMSRSAMKIHHPTSVRSLVFSASLSHPLQAVVGLDNGSIYRWDLQMGQRGQLDRLPVAHTGPILALDWCTTFVTSKDADNLPTQQERNWIVSGGLDHTVKVWELPGSSTSSHVVNKPKYVLHPSYPVRRVLWRPDYPCELALVSNAEFGGGSGAELLASPRLQNATPSFLSATPPSESKEVGDMGFSAGEAVEIWDVRRGWIAKWTVDTNAFDGGVTDAAFRDSHALWVQHASGTFAQIDLRHSHRPIDAVPRVALSWNVVDGSDGTLAFVADRRGQWEVPYDDVHPDRRSLLADGRSKLKALGDKTRMPRLQSVGIYSPSTNAGTNAFARLAKGYVVPDKSMTKQNVCALNAEVAMRAGKVRAAQAWVLLGSLLTDVIPESVAASLSMMASGKVALPYPVFHSASAAGVTGPSSRPASYRAVTADSAVQSAGSSHSPTQSRVNHQRASRSASVNGTASISNEDRKHVRRRPEGPPPLPIKPPPDARNPVSASSMSPRHTGPVSLPPTTTMTPMTTISGRRPSIQVSAAPPRRSSMYARSGPGLVPSVPSVPSVSGRSLRHVGEGALDDSDSSDGAASEVERGLGEALESGSGSGPGFVLGSGVGKARSMSVGQAGPAYPPSSREWAEGDGVNSGGTGLGMGTGGLNRRRRRRVEQDDASPSPVSTDTDGTRSDDDSAEGAVRQRTGMMTSRSRTRKNSNVRDARRLKSRSRSSTVASLAAPRGVLGGVVGPMDSRSSMETVIAASVREHGEERKEVSREGTVAANWAEMRHHQKVAIVEEGGQVKEAGWQVLREAVEVYADEGDVQMCAMLALVASEELKLGLGRTVRFVEAYVDMLMRHRLHASAAYLRKYSRVEEVQRTTRLETVIYTACRKCRKPVVAVRSRNPLAVRSTHAVCPTCKEAVARCSICHLPVRTLLFQCSVCSHGGHQDCYKRYYMERPMVALPAVPLVTRGRQRTEGGISGHPCAAGCGHFCWAAVGQKNEGG